MTFVAHLARADYENLCTSATVTANGASTNIDGINDGEIPYNFDCSDPNTQSCAEFAHGMHWAWVTLTFPDPGVYLSTIIFLVAGNQADGYNNYVRAYGPGPDSHTHDSSNTVI